MSAIMLWLGKMKRKRWVEEQKDERFDLMARISDQVFG